MLRSYIGSVAYGLRAAERSSHPYVLQMTATAKEMERVAREGPHPYPHQHSRVSPRPTRLVAPHRAAITSPVDLCIHSPRLRGVMCGHRRGSNPFGTAHTSGHPVVACDATRHIARHTHEDRAAARASAWRRRDGRLRWCYDELPMCRHQ